MFVLSFVFVCLETREGAVQLATHGHSGLDGLATTANDGHIYAGSSA